MELLEAEAQKSPQTSTDQHLRPSTDLIFLFFQFRSLNQLRRVTLRHLLLNARLQQGVAALATAAAQPKGKQMHAVLMC